MPDKKKLGRNIGLIITALIMLFGIISYSQITEENDVSNIMVIQYPITGEINVHTTPGMKWQWFGKVTTYPKAYTWTFDPDINERYPGIKTTFNDAAEGVLEGSIRVQYPLDYASIRDLHTKFGSNDGVLTGLIKPTVNKNIMVVGTLMNSQESLAERRSSIISWVEDMCNNGIYATESVETRIQDPITGDEKTATTMEIAYENGVPLRTEDSKLAEYGITVDNMSISDIKYGEKVIAQIDRRREAQMEVETAMAEAKKAEQRALTVEQEGRANAAQAKWEQEVIKAKMVTEAEQRKEVAKLDKDAAEFEKQRQILLGQGEAERKKLVMNADGALDKKLEAWLEAQRVWAKAASEYSGNWVPQVSMGGASGGTANGAQDLMDLLTVKTARDLSLEMSVPAGSNNNGGK